MTMADRQETRNAIMCNLWLLREIVSSSSSLCHNFLADFEGHSTLS